jgi:RNA polymerase sigma-70 factor (ECF subfamily)
MDKKSTIIFNELIHRFCKPIERVIAKYFQNSMDRDDVYQEVMIHIFEQLKKIEGDDFSKWEAESWIKVVVKNKCISILRVVQRDSKKEKSTVDDSHLDFEIASSSFADKPMVDSARSLKSFKVEDLLMQLNERDRMLIILRYFKNLSIKEINEISGLSNCAVYLLRAIEKLKKIVGAETFYLYFDDFIIED